MQPPVDSAVEMPEVGRTDVGTWSEGRQGSEARRGAAATAGPESVDGRTSDEAR